MIKSSKISLFAGLAVMLTIGGVFGTWIFGNPVTHASTEHLPNVEVENDFRKWEFNDAIVRFDANENKGYWGNKDAPSSLKQITIPKSSAINPAIYESEISNPTPFDDCYKFVYWSLQEQINDELPSAFALDSLIEDTTTLYAVYAKYKEPDETLLQPVLFKKYDDPSHTYSSNDDVAILVKPEPNSSTWVANEVRVKGDPKERGYHFAIKYGKNQVTEILDKARKDTIIPGLYNVTFWGDNPVVNEFNNQVGFGGKTVFERVYNIGLAGNPVHSYDNFNPFDPNIITLGCIGERKSGQIIYKLYKAKKVHFDLSKHPDFDPCETNFGFIGAPTGDPDIPNGVTHSYFKYDPINPDKSENYATDYIDFNKTRGGKHLMLKGDQLSPHSVFDVYIAATYIHTKFAEPYTCKIDTLSVSLTPYDFGITYYDSPEAAETNDINHIYANENVMGGGLATNYNNAPEKPMLDGVRGDYWKFENLWYDVLYDKVIDFSKERITRNYYVYPLYKRASKLEGGIQVRFMVHHAIGENDTDVWDSDYEHTFVLKPGETVQYYLNNISKTKFIEPVVPGYSFSGYWYDNEKIGGPYGNLHHKYTLSECLNTVFTASIDLYPRFTRKTNSVFVFNTNNFITDSCDKWIHIHPGADGILDTGLYESYAIETYGTHQAYKVEGEKAIRHEVFTNGGYFRFIKHEDGSWTIKRIIGFTNNLSNFYYPEYYTQALALHDPNKPNDYTAVTEILTTEIHNGAYHLYTVPLDDIPFSLVRIDSRSFDPRTITHYTDIVHPLKDLHYNDEVTTYLIYNLDASNPRHMLLSLDPTAQGDNVVIKGEPSRTPDPGFMAIPHFK